MAIPSAKFPQFYAVQKIMGSELLITAVLPANKFYATGSQA